MTDREAAELGLADFEVARAPADDLDVLFFFDRVGERGRFQSGPEFFIRTGHEGEIGRVIHPLRLGVPPATPAALLHAHQSAVVASIRSCQDFTRADDDAGLDGGLDAFGPGLEIVILLAIDFDADQHALPIARGFLLSVTAKTGRGFQQENSEAVTYKADVHSRRSLGTP